MWRFRYERDDGECKGLKCLGWLSLLGIVEDEVIGEY